MRTEQAFLLDILRSAEMVREFIAGKSIDDFRKNQLLQEGVIRRIGIIGEAANQLTPETCDRMPEIPWGDTIRMRNVLIHVYFGVSLERVWSTALEDTITLIAAIRREFPDIDQEPVP